VHSTLPQENSAASTNVEKPGLVEVSVEFGMVHGWHAHEPSHLEIEDAKIAPFLKIPYLPGNKLKWLARFLITFRSYFREIGEGIGRFPLGVVLYGLCHGFSADRVFLYGRQGIRSGQYLSDLQRQFTRFINSKPAREMLEDKMLFEFFAGQFVRVPKNHLYCDNGRLVILSGEWSNIADDKDGEYQFVVKRARGGGGIKIEFVTLHDQIVTIGNSKINLQEFYELFKTKDESILCDFIMQSDFCRTIYPNTTNSVRVICMRDIAREPFVARAVLRLGTQKSKGVDNFGRGGLTAEIDLETGILSEAIEHYAKMAKNPAIHRRHPDTDAPIAGQVLPKWDMARDQSLLLMRELPFVNYVGWDIVLTDEGPVFLEGNNYTGVRLVQAHRGLLQDDRIREFYRRYGIL
jgi:hypothetical protein